MHVRVTNNYLNLRLRKRAIRAVILSFFPATCNILKYYIPPYIEFWQLAPYAYVGMMISNQISFKSLLSTSLKKAGKQLSKSFKVWLDLLIPYFSTWPHIKLELLSCSHICNYDLYTRLDKKCRIVQFIIFQAISQIVTILCLCVGIHVPDMSWCL